MYATPRLSKLISLFLLAVLFTACKQGVSETVPETAVRNPFIDYVLTDDPAFDYEVIHTLKQDNYTYYAVRMTSQHWLTPEVVNETEWWHWVTLVVPDDYTYSTGMMWIGGGTKDDVMPSEPDALTLSAALSTNSVVAQVHNIPFQPLAFADDPDNQRYEDAIIAYGWRKFLEGGARYEDAFWLSRLPMTNAVVSAMDVVQEVIRQHERPAIEHFVVAGASKRGWTTWTTAAVDKRVVAIAPVVIDLLNVVPSFQHHWRNYGAWSPAVDDYVNEGIMEWQGSSEYNRLLEIVEPYSYRQLYTMPKLLINASGDEFFLPDSWKFYYNDLPGEKHLMYVPNTGHDVSGTDALQNLTAFYASILDEKPRPSYTWTIDGDRFVITTDPNNPPTSIKLWKATNETARDFRIYVVGKIWTATDIPVNDSGNYSISITAPDKGWSGYFVELTYPGKIPLKVTTGVEVLPRTYPYEPYVSESPKGTKVN
jgi:PhoPQ-activated pathogenicity-related protein